MHDAQNIRRKRVGPPQKYAECRGRHTSDGRVSVGLPSTFHRNKGVKRRAKHLASCSLTFMEAANLFTSTGKNPAFSELPSFVGITM